MIIFQMAFSFTDMKLNTETWSVVNQPYNYNRVDTVEEINSNRQ